MGNSQSRYLGDQTVRVTVTSDLSQGAKCVVYIFVLYCVGGEFRQVGSRAGCTFMWTPVICQKHLHFNSWLLSEQERLPSPHHLPWPHWAEAVSAVSHRISALEKSWRMQSTNYRIWWLLQLKSRTNYFINCENLKNIKAADIHMVKWQALYKVLPIRHLIASSQHARGITLTLNNGAGIWTQGILTPESTLLTRILSPLLQKDAVIAGTQPGFTKNKPCFILLPL